MVHLERQVLDLMVSIDGRIQFTAPNQELKIANRELEKPRCNLQAICMSIVASVSSKMALHTFELSHDPDRVMGLADVNRR
jgi:hypothetical protein